MTFYRDPLAGLKSQLATKRGLVEIRERELAPLLRAMLPAELRARIDELRAEVLVARDEKEDDVGALSRIDGELDALVLAYDEGQALVPKLRDCPLDVPDPPKPVQPPPWLIEENRQRAFRLQFEARVRELAREAYVVRWGDVRYLARLRVAGAPLVATTTGNFDIVTTTTEFTSALRASVHPSAPVVSVEPAGVFAGVAKLVGIARDDETGDRPFDESFVVDGPDGGALLLTPDVTAAMQRLRAWNAALLVKNGIAEITWSSTFRGKGFEVLHDAAFDVVLGIRAAIERA